VANEPLVSILTPSYNQARWLGDTLQSVARQTYPHIEHIVMDGGSTDGTVELLEGAGARITWKSERDRGQSHALNKALAASTGEIIGWINSDDAFYSADIVATVVEYFARHPAVDVVYGHGALVNANGRILQMLWVPPFRYGLLRFHDFLVQPSVFIRRSALGDTLVDETYHYTMDYELWLRLGRDRRFARLNRVVGIDRNYPGRKSISVSDVMQDELARLHDIYGTTDPGPSIAVRVAKRALKIAIRLLGVTLLRRASDLLAFDGSHDGIRALALRQISMSRARMMAREQQANAS
jgi:glycosyltransferase involved in cell wall biosynthesis